LEIGKKKLSKGLKKVGTMYYGSKILPEEEKLFPIVHCKYIQHTVQMKYSKTL